MNIKDFNPNLQLEALKSEKNLANQRMYNTSRVSEVKVQIYPDKSVSPAKFILNKTIPGTYRAHPDTIRAMREDLFANINNDTFEELEYLYDCTSCKNRIDLQFWKHCPHCTSQFPKDLPAAIKAKKDI